MKKELERTGNCVQCGECCRKMRITAVLSNMLRQHGSLKDAKAYYSFHGVKIVDTDSRGDRVLLELEMPCNQLTADNKCLLADKPDEKPLICHKYPWFEDDIETCGFSFKEKKLF